VFGQSFWTGGVEALLDRPAGADMAELAAAEIVTRQHESRIAGQDEWMFRQALVRDAAYASILEEDRAAMHLAAGAWLKEVGDVDVGLIARHADAGGDLPRAAALYARATRQAYTNGAQLETALDLADRGLACGAEGGVRAQLLIAKAGVTSFLGRLSEAVLAAEEGARMAPAGSDMWGEAQRIMATALIEAGKSTEGDARAAWALGPEFSGLSLAIRSAIMAARVRGLIDMGAPGHARVLADQAVEAALASGALDATLRAMDARTFALMHVGDVSQAVTSGTALIETAESAGDLVLATRGRVNTGSVLNHIGMFEEAQAMHERALADARARRMRILEAFALHNAGMSYARLGNLDEGIAAQRHAARIADETGAARLRIHTRSYEAMFLVWRGGPGDLSAAHHLAHFVCEETQSVPSLYIGALFVMARVQLARRYLVNAVEAAREVERRLAAGPVEEWEEHMRLTLVEALLATGKRDVALAALENAFRVVVDHASAISRADHRKAFLGRNDEVRRIVELARDHLGKKLPDGI
jgi:tetratricopeptide (TPR) repeat protein